MIWCCSNCGRRCIEVYPLEDKTVIKKGLCTACYNNDRKQRTENLRKYGTINEIIENKIWLPALPFKLDTL